MAVKGNTGQNGSAIKQRLVLEKRNSLKGKRIVFIARRVNCKRRDQVASVELAGVLCQSRINGKTDIVVLAKGVVPAIP